MAHSWNQDNEMVTHLSSSLITWGDDHTYLQPKVMAGDSPG